MEPTSAPRAPSTVTAIGLYSGGHFFNDLWGNLYPVLVPLLAAPLGVGLVGGALLITANRLASSVLQPALGRFSDQLALPILGPLALVAGGLATGLLAFTAWLPLFVFLSLVAGAANAGFHPSALTQVRRLSGERRGAATSAFLVGGNAGRAIGPLVMAGAALWLGARGVAAIAVPGLVLGGALTLWAHRALPAPPAAVTAASAPEDAWRLLAGRWRPFAILLAISLARGVVTSAVITFYPLLHGHAARALVGSAALIAVMMLAGSVGNLVGGSLSDRLPRAPLLGAGTLLAGLALALFAVVSGLWLFPAAALAGFFAMSTNAVTMVIGQDLLPESVGLASGVALGLGNAVTSGAVALLAFAAAAWGGEATLLIAAAMAVLGLPASLAYGAMARRLPSRSDIAAGAAG